MQKRLTDYHEMGDDYQRAEFALDARRYDLAIEIMQDVLSRSPENSIAFHTIARAYVYKKMPDEAVKAVKESLRLDPGNSVAHTLYGSLLKDKLAPFWNEAEEELLTAIRLNPAYDTAHYIYAWFLLEQRKNTPLAKQHCLNALELDAADARHHWLLARILTEERLLDQAEKSYLDALRLSPEDARVHSSYGAFLLNQRHSAQAAKEHFRIALEQEPDNEAWQRNYWFALKATHIAYWLYWRSSFWFYWLRRKGRIAQIAVVLLLFLAFYLAVYAADSYAPSTLYILAGVVWTVIPAYWLYMRAINPIFDYLIKRGVIK